MRLLDKLGRSNLPLIGTVTPRAGLVVLVILSLIVDRAVAQSAPSSEQQLLQKMVQMRVQLERERAGRDNEARANVRLPGPGIAAAADNPTVSGLRAQTGQQLSLLEQQFRCLDVDFKANGGNTVVICGNNSGDINGSNVSADRDIVTVQPQYSGSQP